MPLSILYKSVSFLVHKDQMTNLYCSLSVRFSPKKAETWVLNLLSNVSTRGVFDAQDRYPYSL